MSEEVQNEEFAVDQDHLFENHPLFDRRLDSVDGYEGFLLVKGNKFAPVFVVDENLFWGHLHTVYHLGGGTLEDIIEHEVKRDGEAFVRQLKEREGAMA